ncbi:MAG TPA: hypothetical protein VFB50_23530 [Chloroflexota bacterium]|nr:hypothetical protein [Chloroflexota bacterium]
MGSTPADTRLEIDRLRGDLTAALDEVERRLRGGFRGVASTEARITGARAREDLSQRARQHPTLLGVVGVVAVGALGYGLYSVLKSRQESARPQSAIRRRVKDVREELRGRVGEGVQASKRQLERAKQTSLLVKVEPADSGLMRITEAHIERPVNKSKERQDVIKKLVWAGLLSVFMALSSVLARRVAGSVWKAMLQEEPPTRKNK